MEEEEVAALATARVGTILKDRWTIDALIGVGGMASVYAATHRNQKRVAIKMMHPDLSQNVEVRGRFLREGYVANTVDHRGAVSVLDDDITDDGAAFLVMELLEGETLEARRVRKGGRLAADEVLSLTDQLLDALAAAHAKGVVHRDLKPENLFFTHEGVLKVLDFGIARLRDGSTESAHKSATRVGSVMGTPAFMAPEQARARWELVDARTDLWAVGATMYTLLSGRFVREGGTVNEELALAITAPPTSLAKTAPDVPPAVVAVVDRAMAFEKADRWADAATMQAAVRHAYGTLSGHEGEGAGQGGAPVRMMVPSIVDGGGAPIDASAPTLQNLTTGDLGAPPPPERAVVLRWRLVGGGIALATALMIAAFAVFAVRRAPAEAAAMPEAPALASGGPSASAAPPVPSVEPSATAEPAATAEATADPAPSGEPSASESAAPSAAPVARAPVKVVKSTPKPAPRPPEPPAKPAKKDRLERLESFLKRHQL